MAHKNLTNVSPYKTRNPEPSKGNTGGKPGAGRHRKPTESYNFNEADDRLYDVFRNHGFGDYPHEKRRQLTRYFQMLMESQKKQNFTRLLTLRDVGLRHFVDCLMVTRLTKLAFPLLDVGTGPGLPGIPLKIEFPDETIILAEGVQKRVDFLKKVRDELELDKLPIIGRNINSEFFYPVQGVITRAVEDCRNTLGNVVHSLQTGGRVYFMKGPGCDPEIDLALEAWGEYYALEENIQYELPQSPHERRLVIFKKTKPFALPDFETLDLAWEKENAIENDGEQS